MVKADAEGRFRMSVYGDFKYEIKGEVYVGKTAKSEKVKVPDLDKPGPFKLVLKPG